ncbi:MAG TPA: hypothetical protein VIR27_01730 [Mycobacteriales bacterium]|jgi:hypothetical protein
MTTNDLSDTPARISRFLRTAAAQIDSRLGPLGRTTRPHLGFELAHTDDPNVRRLRDSGAHFDWLALSFDPVPMWDLHVGLVMSGPDEVQVGVHVLDETGQEIRAAADSVGAAWSTPQFSASVHEHQYNRTYVITGSAEDAEIWAAAASLCRSLHTELHAGEPAIGQGEEAQ